MPGPNDWVGDPNINSQKNITSLKQYIDQTAAPGNVNSVSAADTSIVVGGTGANPTIRTNTLDVIATQHPPAANVPMNAFIFTGLGAGSASGHSIRWEQLNGIVTTNGDILYATGAGAFARLGVGGTNTALVVAAGIPSWAAIANSVFGRTGAVVAATNDYTDLQVQNSPTNILTTTGDILYASAANTLHRLAIGTTNQVLTVSGGLPSWQANAAGFANPMVSVGDIIVGGTAGAATRTAIGTTNQILAVVGGVPTWQSIATNQDPLLIDFVQEYVIPAGGNASGSGGESGNATAWANLMTDLTNNTTRGGIRDISMIHQGQILNFNTTLKMQNINGGCRMWFLSPPTFNETVGTNTGCGYFRWTGAADTYMVQVLNTGTTWNSFRTIGCWNMVTSNDNQGFGIVIDNNDNWYIDEISFGANGGSTTLQRGITCWSTTDNAHGVVGRLYSNNCHDSAVYAEGGGFNIMAGNISSADRQVGAFINGKAQRSVSDAVTNATTLVTSATGNFDANFDIGRPLSGTNIVAGSYIHAVNSATSINMNQNASGSGSGGSLVIGSAVPGSEMKFYPGVKIDGGASGNGSGVGIMIYGANTVIDACDFEGFNSFSYSASNITTSLSNATIVATSGTPFSATDAPSRLRPGAEVRGPNVPVGARILTFVSSTKVVLDQNCTGAGSGQTMTVIDRAVAIDLRRVEENNYSARNTAIMFPNFTGHNGSMLPIRCSYAPGTTLGNAFGNQVYGPRYTSCLIATGGNTDTNFFSNATGTPGVGDVTQFADNWHDNKIQYQ